LTGTSGATGASAPFTISGLNSTYNLAGNLGVGVAIDSSIKLNLATSTAVGVQAGSTASGGTGVLGFANTGTNPYGVWGTTSATTSGSIGVAGDAAGGMGVRGTSTGASGFGVLGSNTNTATTATGVSGSGNRGVSGSSGLTANGSNGTQANRLQGGGVFGSTSNANGNAGFFLGRVVIENTFAAGAATNDQGVNSPDALIVWTNTGASGFNRSGAVFQPSDRNAKNGFTAVDARQVLEKLVETPVTRWHYKNDDKTWYMGPMAQDFKAAFELGDKDTVIHGVNADGVALAAIQGLNSKLESELKTRDAAITAMDQRLMSLETSLKLSKSSPTPAGIGLGAALVGLPAVAGLAIARRRNKKILAK